jgi:RES domain-containing protein
MNFEAVSGLPSKLITGTWYRAIPPQHILTALKYSQSRDWPSRYNGGRFAQSPFDTIYLAETPIVAQLEAGALLGSSLSIDELIANPAANYSVLNVRVQLRNVLDLTDVEQSHGPLGTNAQELTGDWLAYHHRTDKHSVPAPVGLAPTQELGAAIYACGQFSGFAAISAKFPYAAVLGIFPDRIDKDDFLQYLYTDAAGQKHIFNVP